MNDLACESFPMMESCSLFFFSGRLPRAPLDYLYNCNLTSGSDIVPLSVSSSIPRNTIDVAGLSTFSSFSGTLRSLQVLFRSSWHTVELGEPIVRKSSR